MFPLRITHNPPLSQCSCLVLTAGGAAVLFTCVCVCVCTRVCVCVCARWSNQRAALQTSVMSEWEEVFIRLNMKHLTSHNIHLSSTSLQITVVHSKCVSSQTTQVKLWFYWSINVSIDLYYCIYNKYVVNCGHDVYLSSDLIGQWSGLKLTSRWLP